jgi:hypothetical protein
MSEDIHLDGQNEEVEFEREDLAAKPILIFLIVLTVICVLVAVLLRGMYSYMDARENRNQSDQSPLVQQSSADTRVVGPAEITKFPQPRLESTETTEINAFRLQEEQTLNSYGWVDQEAGVVRIPINRAMELTAQRGLPTRPPAGAPASAAKAKK